MKRKHLTVVIILLFIANITIPATANNTVDLENEKESACTGRIYGEVGNSHGMYTWSPCPFALVTTETKQTRCGPGGQYSMRLSLYHEYNVTAHVIGFEPLTKHVYLTAEEPNKELYFDMCGRELTDSKPFGKVSNVRSGGYTPAYWFHIVKVMIIVNNQVPKVQWLEDRESHMLSMDFRPFIGMKK